MHVKIYLKKRFLIKMLSVCLTSLVVSFSCWALSSNSGKPDSSPPNDAVRLPVLMYHLVLRNPQVKNKFVVSESTFEEDLKYIKDNGYTTILVQDLINYTESPTFHQNLSF